MFKKDLTKKVLAMALVFTLTFANLALVTKTYAASIFGTVFSNAGSTGSKHVEFEVYFKNGEEKTKSIEADVNDENLKLNFDLKLEKGGYVKEATVEILELKENEGLNFKVKDGIENENIESFENNQLKLVKVSGESENTIEIPIEYVYEEFITLDKLSKDFKVRFTGIYVDEKANEVNLEKEMTLNLSWKDNREFNVESNLTKFFEYQSDGENYSTLQTLIKIDTNTEKKSLPIENIETKIEMPKIEGTEITNIAIVPQSTEATNNKTNEEVVFDESNISVDEETNSFVIKTKNDIQTVNEISNEEEVLKETDEQQTSEKYFSGKGVDEYLITYTIKNLNMEEQKEVKQKISTTITNYGPVGKEEGQNKTDKEIEGLYTVSESIGENISYEALNETENISKGYIYLNADLENKYTLEYRTKSIINISNHDLAEEIQADYKSGYYLQKDGTRLDANDVFYKNIAVSKENFEKILGADGKIEVLDTEGNVLKILDLSIEPKEEYLVVELDGDLTQISLRISNPIAEGNLNINTIRRQVSSNYDKTTYQNIDSLNEEIIVRAKYKDADQLADVGNKLITTKLEDTSTNVNLVLNKESLSTLVENTDVEFKIEFNNHKMQSDIFGNSVFEIELPEYVRSVEVTNTSIVYGDGLEITKVEAFEKDGKAILRITVNGKQVNLSSGIVTNGTNVVVTANIKIDEYAPAKQEEIKLYYYNEESTNYLGETQANSLGLVGGVTSKVIEYSAPTGVVSVNSISNYDNKNSNVVSINQGTKKDKIDIYSQSRNAKMELIVMNNQSNAISNVSILGRIPFKGIKDIVSGKEMGTTIDSKLITQINENVNNNMKFNIYYSQNGEADNHLNNASNGWTMQVEDLSTIKSFLIVPVDANYVMEPSTILRFHYEYFIPENLEHNTDIYSTFATYYTTQAEAGNHQEISAADIVYLTTGVGPQFSIETSINTDKPVTEFEEFKITSKVTNTGKDTAYDVKVGIPVPENTEFIKANNNETVTVSNEDRLVNFNIDKIERGESVEVSINVKIGNVEMSGDSTSIEVYSRVDAKDLGKTIESERKQVTVKQAEMKVELISDRDDFDRILPENSEIEMRLEVTNLKEETLKNAIATMKIDDQYEFIRAYTEIFDGSNFEENDENCFDITNRMLEWKIGDIEGYNTKILKIQFKLKNLEGGITKKNISNIVTTKADGTEEYISPERTIIVGGASLEIKQTTSTADTYVKEGTKIEYIFEVKNVGVVMAESVTLTDKIPTGLTVTDIHYSVNGIEANQKTYRQDEATIYVAIEPGNTLIANITAIANNIGEVDELSVTNTAIVSGDNVESVTSNSITHIIEASEPTPEYQESHAQASSDTSSNTNLTKTYRISGLAWLDSNENGMREESEELLSAISAMLVDADTGVIKSKTTTNSKGAYTFTNVENGNYMIIFDYDTSSYTVTGYQKENVASNVNSDVITTTIQQDGKQRTGAVTDVLTIDNGSISNIDIGLVLADSFDLQLEKRISKLTVQTAKGTETINCDNSDIAKTEIAAKHLAGATVYIEYNIKVSNVGELAGYAKKIIDYMPEDVSFNSGLNGNENWYTGSDGNLYSSSLADVNLGPGESKEIKLILTKQMTEENTGLVSNTAEIFEDYNVYGVSDKNSTAGNKVQNENDMSTADVYIGVKTGEVFIYISVMITTAILGGIVIFLAYNKLIYRKRKVGV